MSEADSCFVDSCPLVSPCRFVPAGLMESDASRELRLEIGRLMESDPTFAKVVSIAYLGGMESASSDVVHRIRQLMESDQLRKLVFWIGQVMESNASAALRPLLNQMESDQTCLTFIKVLRALFESDPSLTTRACLLESSWLVQGFSLRRAYEGPQLVMTWGGPDCVMDGMYVRLVRKALEYPQGPTDGKIVFEGAAESGCYADLDLEECVCYHYTMFTYVPHFDEWVSSVRTQANAIAIRTGFFVNKLWDMLPGMYLIADKKLDERPNTGHLVLSPVFDSGNCEWRNIHENVPPFGPAGPKSRGQLGRVLKLIAAELDIVKGLIDCMPGQYDVDSACCGTLPAMASIIGLELNREFSCGKQREEIKTEVAIYKIKGTVPGIEAKLRQISGADALVLEHCKLLMVSNSLSTVTLGGNPNAIKEFGLPGDRTGYTVGGKYHIRGMSFFLKLDENSCIDGAVIDKINRVLPEYMPMCTSFDLAVVDEAGLGEGADVVPLPTETMREEIEDVAAHDDYERRLWFFSNGSLTNGPLLTAHPFRIGEKDRIDTEYLFKDFDDHICDRVLISNRLDRRSNSFRALVPPAMHTCALDSDRCEAFREFVDCYRSGHNWILSNCRAKLSNQSEALSAYEIRVHDRDLIEEFRGLTFAAVAEGD